MKCPKKHVKDDFVMWLHLPIYLKCPKIEEFHFWFLFGFKIDHVRINRNAPFFYVRNIWNAPFFPFSESDQEKWSISNNWHVINFKTEKEPKIKFFDFGAFQINGQMESHDNIIFHMLFGAFHITPRTYSTSVAIVPVSYRL